MDPAENGPTVCYRHPQVETGLRCNRCNRPICPRCARQTPVGYRCPDCIGQVQSHYTGQARNLNPLSQGLHTPYFTPILVGSIVLIWLWMEMSGGSTNDQVLVDFGANYGPLILEGEVWRFFTSMFLHIGLVHLIFNSFALIALGLDMERVYGPGRYIVVYVLTGLFGSLASFAQRGAYEFSAGASGAVFGVIGMDLAFFLLYRHDLGSWGRQKIRSTLWLIGINLMLGFTVVSINNTAHVGGLVSGFVLGYGLAPRYQVDPSGARQAIDRASLTRRWWVLALAILILALGTWWSVSVHQPLEERLIDLTFETFYPDGVDSLEPLPIALRDLPSPARFERAHLAQAGRAGKMQNRHDLKGRVGRSQPPTP